MPISRDKKLLYPKNWKALSLQVRAEANNKCELCDASNGEPHPVTKSRVVLTVHHMDFNPTNNERYNLIALCQRCHNRLDAKWRARSRACEVAIMPDTTSGVLAEVLNERAFQEKKWGQQNHPPIAWVSILGEEYGEVCKAVLEAHFDGYEDTGNYANARKELIQVAAVAVAMVESLDRNELKQ